MFHCTYLGCGGKNNMMIGLNKDLKVYVQKSRKRKYGVNKRSSLYLIKLKQRQDDEAEVIGIREGLRPEDMCFVLKTKGIGICC